MSNQVSIGLYLWWFDCASHYRNRRAGRRTTAGVGTGEQERDKRCPFPLKSECEPFPAKYLPESRRLRDINVDVAVVAAAADADVDEHGMEPSP